MRCLPRSLSMGWPVTVEVARTIPAPPSVVWRLITDWEHQGDWMLEARDFVVLSQDREGIGVRAEATVKIGGITTRDVVEVVGWEPNHRLAIAHEGWVSGLGELFLTPVGDDRTFVFWREELRPPLGAAGAIGLGIFKPLMRRVFARDLRALATLAAAEARPRGAAGHGGGRIELS